MSSGVPYCRACAIWASTLCWSSGCTRVNSVAKSGSGASAQMPNKVRISSETYRRRSRTRISHSPTWATRWRKSNRSPSVERGARAGLVVGGGMAQQSGALGTRLRKAWRYRGQDRARRRRRRVRVRQSKRHLLVSSPVGSCKRRSDSRAPERRGPARAAASADCCNICTYICTNLHCWVTIRFSAASHGQAFINVSPNRCGAGRACRHGAR